MKRNPVYRWIAIIAVLVMVTAACTVDDPDSQATTEATATDTTEADTSGSDGSDDGSDDGDSSTDDPATDADRTTLEVYLPQDPVGFNPFPQTAGDMSAVHLGLLIPLFDTDGDNNVISDLLESWEISDDASTVTLNVTSGLEWSDGTPITSADIAFSLGMHLDPNISFRATRLAGVEGVTEFSEGEADSISGITTPDDQTVVIQLENPDAAWLSGVVALRRNMTMWPHHILGNVPHEEIPEHPYFEDFPVVSGPYQFVQYVPEQFVELERNENWSLGEAGFERLFYKIITEPEAAVAQLQAGEIQFMDEVSPQDAERLQAIDGITVDTATGLNPNLIGLNVDNPLLEDPRVRRALLFAVDREGICREVLSGFCSVPTANMRLIGLDWAVPSPAEGAIEYTYDPDRARELLEEADWDSSNTLNLLHRPTTASAAMTSAIEIMQAQWADVGINVEIVNVDVGTLLDRLGREERDPDSHMFWNQGADFTLDPSSVQPYAMCDTRYPDGPNLTWLCNPELDELWVEARQVADQDARGEIYKEIFLWKNMNPDNIFIAVTDNIVAYDSRLNGVEPIGDTRQTYWNIGEWTWEG